MIEIDRKQLAMMMECGYIMVGMQRFSEARDVFEGIAVMAPDSEIPVVALGSVAFCEGKFKEAMKHYQKALKIDGTSLFARAYLGEAKFFGGDTEGAVTELKAVFDAEPESKVGIFAKALLDAIDEGFTPESLSGVEEIAQLRKEREDAG